MSTDFYGQGPSLDWQLDGAGGIRETYGVQKIEESIRVILETQHGERLMRPEFGSNLKRLAFAPNNEATANLARYYVEESLRRWEPRIELIAVQIENDNRHGRLLIHISYRPSSSPDVRNMVYPFYLEQPA